jgi:hypothetical protein
MDLPEHFFASSDYICYRPAAVVTFAQVIELCSTAVAFARAQNIQWLLVDTMLLTGFGPPNTVDRFEFAQRCAQAADGAVKVAFVARLEMIDGERFGVQVARNRGFLANIFSSEAEALDWLREPE